MQKRHARQNRGNPRIRRGRTQERDRTKEITEQDVEEDRPNIRQITIGRMPNRDLCRTERINRSVIVMSVAITMIVMRDTN